MSYFIFDEETRNSGIKEKNLCIPGFRMFICDYSPNQHSKTMLIILQPI